MPGDWSSYMDSDYVQFRSSGRSNRSGRLGQAEHDVFEGLPVRQWRQTGGTFGLPPPQEIPQDKDCIFPELPMPPDSRLLQSWTQQLLREARKPRSAKRKSETTKEEKPEEEEEQKERHVQVGWSATKWSQVPRHLEEPEHEYLAKRRKGLPSAYSEAPVFVPQVATRTAKVRKLDAAGNPVIYDVIVPEGQVIEGEVKDEDVAMTEAPSLAPGTVVEGIGVANAEGQVVANDLLQPTPQRRRKPPPPKRKGGPGRGKKKVMFQPQPAADGTTTTDGLAVPTDGTNGTPVTPSGTDPNGANGEGDDDEGEEGEDGDDDNDEDREDGELSDPDAPPEEAPPATALEQVDPNTNQPPDAQIPEEVMTDVTDIPQPEPPLSTEPASASALPSAAVEMSNTLVQAAPDASAPPVQVPESLPPAEAQVEDTTAPAAPADMPAEDVPGLPSAPVAETAPVQDSQPAPSLPGIPGLGSLASAAETAPTIDVAVVSAVPVADSEVEAGAQGVVEPIVEPVPEPPVEPAVSKSEEVATAAVGVEQGADDEYEPPPAADAAVPEVQEKAAEPSVDGTTGDHGQATGPGQDVGQA